MSDPRIMQVMAGAAQGGAEGFFVRLVAALHRRGLEQRVIIRRDAARAALLRAAGIVPGEARFGGPIDLATRWQLSREIRAFAPRVVLTWMNRATAMLRPVLMAHRPFVHAARLGGYYDLKYYRRCDILIGNTPAIVAYIRDRGWPEARVRYLPNFVDGTARPPVDRAALGTPADAPVILALGRLHPVKGFDGLIEALPLLPDAWLWLAGEGPLRPALEAQAARLGVGGRVRFLGWRQDGPALMAAADLLVCPSRHEPLGNVIIEAWAHRLPVIAAAADGPRALIRDGETGLIVPVDDRDALAGSIGRVIGDPALRDRLRAGGEEAYRAAYTEEQVCGAYRRFFAEVAG